MERKCEDKDEGDFPLVYPEFGHGVFAYLWYPMRKKIFCAVFRRNSSLMCEEVLAQGKFIHGSREKWMCSLPEKTGNLVGQVFLCRYSPPLFPASSGSVPLSSLGLLLTL